MFKANQERKEQVDKLGRLVLRAAAKSETEAEAAAASPFLYTRVRAAIADEQRRRDEAGGWLSLFSVARHAVPAMALVAILTAILTLLSIKVSAPSSPVRFDEDALFDARDNGVEQTILANRNGLSRDEVFGIVVDRSDREKK